ncbi:hypothetical protein [Pseudoalteromonas rubra]|uniref:Uncharacterized protein n=1 Tax=Pseudoalteromonas rubra TaxID=43658 RepID=A0A0F4QI24_9GAMM|nr:hypothetical protein [Pseudoalteromonas rubra]KJZ07281.1 hypothetical protein TW77_16070 [Pseudoalteromonas rubra]
MKKEISTSFNLLATGTLLFVMFVFEFFTMDFSGTYEDRTLLGIMFFQAEYRIIFLLLLFMVVAITASFIFKEVWNRLIRDLFKIRGINLNEAYSICFLVVVVISI